MNFLTDFALQYGNDLEEHASDQDARLSWTSVFGLSKKKIERVSGRRVQETEVLDFRCMFSFFRQYSGRWRQKRNISLELLRSRGFVRYPAHYLLAVALRREACWS